MLRTITATQYVTPLREGGSLPAIVEGSDDGTYVLKFRGAGQGPLALVAELVSGEIGRLLGLPVPEIVLVELDRRMAMTERDPEIQELLQRSAGLNLALDYLPGSITFDPVVDGSSEETRRLASSIVWFDAFVTNVDRTARNTNMLLWHRRLWLIDHGASLYFHHQWDDAPARATSAFPQIRDHVLLRWADGLPQADQELAAKLTPTAIERVTALIPGEWLVGDAGNFASESAHREAYRDWLLRRLAAPRPWFEEALRARALLV